MHGSAPEPTDMGQHDRCSGRRTGTYASRYLTTEAVFGGAAFAMENMGEDLGEKLIWELVDAIVSRDYTVSGNGQPREGI